MVSAAPGFNEGMKELERKQLGEERYSSIKNFLVGGFIANWEHADDISASRKAVDEIYCQCKDDGLLHGYGGMGHEGAPLHRYQHEPYGRFGLSKYAVVGEKLNPIEGDMLDGGFTHVYGDPKEFIHKHGYNYFAYARNNLKADMFWDKDGRVVYHEHPPEGVHHHHVGHPEGQFSDHEHANGSDSEEGHEGEVRDGRERDPHYGPAHEAMHDAHRQTEQYGPFMPQGHPERRNREGGGVRTREEKIEMLRRLAAFGEHLQQKYNLRTPEDIQKNPDAVKELEAFMRNLHPEYGPRGGSHRERPPQEPYGPQRPDVPHTQGPHTTPDHSSYQQPLEDSVMYIDDSVSGSHGGKDATAGGLEHAVLDIAKKGHGRPYVRIPRALHQRGLDCQTYTLMNGVLGIGGAAYLKEKNIPDLVDDIRKKAKHGRVPRAELMMTKVDAYFPEVGIPLKPMRITANLGNITQHLFKENRFLGLIEDIGYAQKIPHATAIIPLQNPTEKKFAVQMDSLTGTNNTLSLDDYLRIFKNFDPLHHNMIVYELE